MHYSEKVTNRFIELIEQGKIFYPDEIKLMEYLINKYKPKTLTNYSKLIEKSYKTISLKYHAKELAYLKIDEVPFILSSLN